MRKQLSLILLTTIAIGCGDESNSPTSGDGNGSTELARWNFAEDLDGWDAGTHATNFGSVVWLDREGGIVKLDGVGFDGDPNAWISSSIDLPGTAATLRLSTSAHDRNDGAVSLRIRLIDESAVEHTILDWDELSTGDEGFEFFEQSFDISAFAGQTVTLYIEIGDIDGGGNNQRYIDYVVIDE